MPAGEQMNPVLFHVEGVNDSVVTNASSKTVRSFQSTLWKSPPILLLIVGCSERERVETRE